MSQEDWMTDPTEFKKFYSLLMSNAPKGNKPFSPFLFPCEKGGKEPVPGISWKKNKKSFSQALKLMEKGYNIGIAGTDADSLCILDVDDMTQVPLEEIKWTLAVISRKRIGRHYYYFSPDLSAKKNVATSDAGELRSSWQYVLAPGSYVRKEPC
jgi:putative DNA primase/helicase